MDRSGRELERLGPVAMLGDGYEFSPDGKRLAFHMIAPGESNWDVWLLDLDRDLTIRFTTDPGTAAGPIWSPDGTKIYYRSMRHGKDNRVYEKPSSGLGEERELPMPPGVVLPFAVTPDGRYLLASMCPEGEAFGERWDLVKVPLDGSGRAIPFVRQRKLFQGCSLSPDGKWIAYASGETGRTEAYVGDFPAMKDVRRVSTEGAFRPTWSADGKELIYYVPDKGIFSTAIATAPSFHVGKSVRILEDATEVGILIPAPDGRRFLGVQMAEGGVHPPIQVVLNWPASVRRR
jgi:Tol biopolymer transport system component